MSRLPRKLKKKLKKESLKQERIQSALKAVGIACQTSMMIMQAYLINTQAVNTRLAIKNLIVN